MDRKWTFRTTDPKCFFPSYFNNSIESTNPFQQCQIVSSVARHLSTNPQPKFGTEDARRKRWPKRCRARFRCVEFDARCSSDSPSDWSGSLRVERWPRSIWTINRSHPKARPRLLLRRLLCPSRHRVRVHLLFHPCLAFSFFDRIVTVKTSALSSVYPFLWLFFLAPSRIHA